MDGLQTSERKLAPHIDVVSAVLALEAALLVTNFESMPSGFAAFLALRITIKNLLLLGFFLAGWHVVFLCCRLYEDDSVPPLVRWKRLLMACTIGSVPVLLFSCTSTTGLFGPVNVGCFWLFSILLSLFSRACRTLAARLLLKSSVRRCLIVGSGRIAADLAAIAKEQSPYAREVLGFVDDPGPHTVVPEIRARMRGRLADLERILKDSPVDEVLIGLPIKSCYEQIQRVIRVCEVVGVQCGLPSLTFSYSIARPEIEGVRHPVLTLKVVRDDSHKAVKRAIDICGALVGLIVFAPVLLAIAALVKLTSRGPAVFSQARYGLNRRKFRMYKFRTMVENAEMLQAGLEGANEASGPVFKIRKDPRVTPIGRFLRRTSLDELPQLWNVLTGKMSLVGPRPLPERDVSRFSEAWLMRRFSVKPGLTCLWQITGRSDTAFDRWIELDLMYIDTWSLRLDMEILAKTVSCVLRGQGAA